MMRSLCLAIVASAAGTFGTAAAQDSTGADRAFVLEGRAGVMQAIGGTGRMLIDPRSPDAAMGVTLGFQLSSRTWGWVSVDYKPDNQSARYGSSASDVPPIGLYALTAGVSRSFGLPGMPARWTPFELGLGAGATQTEIWPAGPLSGAAAPPEAELESVAESGLLGYRRWRPAAAGRLRIAVPIGPLRLSGTAGLLATYVGNVRLWDGGWEPTGEGNRYRPTAKVWRFGTVVTVPLTVGFGFTF